jgi:hypothetical protein
VGERVLAVGVETPTSENRSNAELGDSNKVVDLVIDEGDVSEICAHAFVQNAEVVSFLDAGFLVEDQFCVEHVAETELVEQEPYRTGVLGGCHRRHGLISMTPQRL